MLRKLRGIVALGQRADVTGERPAVGLEGAAPLGLGRGGGGALEVIERELGVDGQAAPPRQPEQHVRPPALREGRLQVEVAVLAEAGVREQVLQRDLTGPAAVRGVREDVADPLDVLQNLARGR
jgi:hypothetical protein